MNAAARAAHFFLPELKSIPIVPFGSGNINDTFLITSPEGENKILQRLNPDVFPDPLLVMHNMRIVLNHLHQVCDRSKPASEGLRFISLYHGETGDSYQDNDGSIWRLMSMVDNCRTCRTVSSTEQAEELGRGLGVFHRLLSTLDARQLGDTLPGFHSMPEYLARYDLLAENHDSEGDSRSAFCCSFIGQRRLQAFCLEREKDRLYSGIIHGDPKTANFLFDRNEDRVISLIDLDTVKPGHLIHDLGDALRSTCNPAGETAEKPDQVYFDHVFFQSWLQGYLAEAGSLLSDHDKAHIVDAAWVLSFELGLRFFTDHLEGNRYFKTDKPDQNIERAMNQFALVQSIEDHFAHLQDIVSTALKN